MQFLTEPGYADWIAQHYPGTIALADGTELSLTPMVPSDWELLERFLHDVPPEEKKFFRHEASEPARVERWCRELDYTHVLPLLVWSGDRIVADGILERDLGLWTSHVGKVRLVVHPELRGRGIGRALLRELIVAARHVRLHKLLAEVAAEQADMQGLLQSEGFSEAARLSQFVRDRNGQLHDLVMLVASL